MIIPSIPVHLIKTTSTGHLSKANQKIRWTFLSKARAPAHEHAALLTEAGTVTIIVTASKEEIVSVRARPWIEVP